MSSFTIENVEEVMISDSDGHDERSETVWDSRLAAIDMFLMIINAVLLVILAVAHRFELLKEHRRLFYIMVLFLMYQILSYLFVLLISAVVYLALLIACKSHLAYSLMKVYRWLQSITEFCLLTYCAIEGLIWLWQNKDTDMTYHQIFFICMILTVAFKIARLITAFCHKTPAKRMHLMYIGGQVYKVHHDTENKQREEILKMMDNIQNCTLVKDDERITVDGIELN